MTNGYSQNDDQILLLVKKFVEHEIRLLRAVSSKSSSTASNTWNDRENKFRNVISLRPGTSL